jgi:hypothetical protein
VSKASCIRLTCLKEVRAVGQPDDNHSPPRVYFGDALAAVLPLDAEPQEAVIDAMWFINEAGPLAESRKQVTTSPEKPAQRK